jgi:BirA family biotin operon repressor/biotin-[acetyl-CoA-carboxylase] ligase
LRECLTTNRIGRRIEWRPRVDSTQREIRRLTPEAEDGTVLIAETQDSGKGRMLRNWFSPAGGIWMSVFLKPAWPKSHQLLGLAFASAVARAILTCTRLLAVLKWPNDLIIESKKVSGILSEGCYANDGLTSLIVGLGINANIEIGQFGEDLRSTATSLSHECRHDVDRDLLAKEILEEMDRTYLEFESGRVDGLLNEVKRLCSTLRRTVRVIASDESFEGEAVDIDEEGQLLVRAANGATVAVHAADVVHLR